MEQRRFRLLISSFVALVALQIQAEAQGLPKLVVCITVDQLRSDFLEELSPLMGSDGLRKMIEQGHYTPSIHFPLYQPNQTSATATIHTGALPHLHGAESAEVYLRDRKQSLALYWDDQYQGLYTRESLSPRNLLVPTLGDRLKEASRGSALVYSIATDADAALSAGGNLADGVYWLDSKIASWSTSSFYPSMPSGMEQYNRSAQGPNKRLISGQSQWKPLKHYPEVKPSYAERGRSFSYRYQGTDAIRYKQSPLANEEVTNLALRLIDEVGYVERKAPGLLSIGYSARPYGSGELEAEDVDTYVRLDADISRLLKALDSKIGLKNCLISLSGTGYTQYTPSTTRARQGAERLQRQVSVARLSALANMYLTALYGQGTWIEHHANGRIYLNRQLIENRKVNIGELRRSLAGFLTSADGVAGAYAIDDIRQGASTEALQRIARSVHSRYEADVYWTLLPGWSVEELTSNPMLQPRSMAIGSPFILMGESVETSQSGLVPRDVRDIVRIICVALRIRPPTDY